jgi:dipeptidyl aminopeptidase/acylaminoacyl peptidase
MRTIVALLFTTPALLIASFQDPLPVGNLTFSEPRTLAEIDIDKLKGEPSRLAWSPDGSQLYFQTLEGGFGKPNVKLRHYVFAIATGAREELQAEPAWASEYWTAKSGQASPDGPPFKIELKSEQRTERTTSTPMGGDLARGGTTVATGASTGEGVSAAYATQQVMVHSMLLAGQTVGEFVNSVIVPGLTFGWGPKGTKVIAFAAQKSGRVVVLDPQGAKQEVAESKDALLPAWSPDATRLAWLQKAGRKEFRLQISQVKW